MALTNSAVKTPDAESETPTRIQPAKPPPSSNGVLKRHNPLHLHHGHPVVVKYKECLKNHAATLGGHAVDGCGEFMPSPSTNPADPTSLKCAACGCHRNFHRREPEEPFLPNAAALALEYRPHHRHHPPPPPHSGSPDNSPSPPPISSSYYPSAPHMLLALSHGMSGPPADSNALIPAGINTSSPPLLSSNSRKRFRTKFTQNQKEKMLEFAERVEWKIQRKDEDLINGFCSEIGVEKGVLKVWMHNNKNNFGKKDQQSNTNTTALSSPPSTTNNDGGMSCNAAADDFDKKENGQLQELHHHHHHHHQDDNNESSSS